MSDLISRSELIKKINELLKSPYANQQQFGAERRETIEIVRDLCVKNQPTAYDIDKVVEELEKERKRLYSASDDCCAVGDFRNAEIYSEMASCFYKAIEIVKQGGVCSNCIEAGNCDVRSDCPNKRRSRA